MSTTSLDELRRLSMAAQENDQAAQRETEPVSDASQSTPEPTSAPRPATAVTPTRRETARRPVKRTKPTSAPAAPSAPSVTPASPPDSNGSDNSVNKITRTWKDCRKTEIADAQDVVQGLADYEEKLVSSRCSMILWNALGDIKGNDPRKPLTVQKVFAEAVALRVLFDRLGVDVKEFLGE